MMSNLGYGFMLMNPTDPETSRCNPDATVAAGRCATEPRRMNDSMRRNQYSWISRGVLILIIGIATFYAQAQVVREEKPTGWDYFRQKHFDKALPLLEKDQRLYPRNFKIIDGVGWCHYFLGDLDAAEKSFQRALDIAPDYEFSRMGLDSVRQARLASIDPVCELHVAAMDYGGSPGAAYQVSASSVLGWALLRLGGYEDAVPAFERAPALSGDCPDALTGLGYVAMARDRHAAAERFFQTALEQLPVFPAAQLGLQADVHCALGWTWLELGKTRLAREYFMKALEAEPCLEKALEGLKAAAARTRSTTGVSRERNTP